MESKFNKDNKNNQNVLHITTPKGFYDYFRHETSEYKSTIPYPKFVNPPKQPTASADISEHKKFVAELEEYRANELKRKEQIRKCREEDARLYNQFKSDVMAAIGVAIENPRSPKVEMLFNLAWEDGHPYGYDSVLELVDKYLPLVMP